MIKRYVAALAATALLGCMDTQGAGDEPDVPETETEAELFSRTGTVLWPTHTIPVCFSAATFDTTSFAARRQTVRNTIENNFGRVTDLRFTGWGRCPSVARGQVRINFKAGVGADVHLGLLVRALIAEVRLDAGGGFVTLILHEFAHALGFEHEFDRLDNTGPTCLADPIKRTGTSHTPYDDVSVLNSTYDGCVDRTDLSPWDVIGMQNLYGKKPLGALVGANNKCADIENPGGGQPAGATRVQAWECLGNSNQQWSYDTLHRFRASNFTYGYLDAQNGSSANGTPIWNWVSQPNPAQTWEMDRAQIVGLGDLCLEVPNNQWFVGQTLRLATCNATSNAQRFAVINSGSSGGVFSLRGSASGTTGFCVSITNQSAKLATCANANAAQSLLLHKRHFATAAGQCLDVQWANPAPGTTVWGWPCDWVENSVAQQWKIAGQLKGIGGKCMAVDATGGVQNGRAVQLATCSSTNVNQRWEWHF